MMFPSVLSGYNAMRKIADGRIVSIENGNYVWTKAEKLVGTITCGEMSCPMIDIDVWELDINGKVVKRYWEHSGHTSTIELTLYYEEDDCWYKVVYEYEHKSGDWIMHGDSVKTDEPVVEKNITELVVNDSYGMTNITRVRL